MITEQDINDLIIHLNIHYDEADVPLSPEDNDLIIEALEAYKQIVQNNQEKIKN